MTRFCTFKIFYTKLRSTVCVGYLQVFIHNNELHIIPRPQSPAEVALFPAGTPSLLEAVNCVRKSASRTRADPAVQKALKVRVKE